MKSERTKCEVRVALATFLIAVTGFVCGIVCVTLANDGQIDPEGATVFLLSDLIFVVVVAGLYSMYERRDRKKE